MSAELKFDEIGDWSEIKLEIIRKYAVAYSNIFAKRRNFTHYYIDAFSGAGMHVSKQTGELVSGSPVNALNVQPPFDGYFFIDLDKDKTDALRAITGERSDVEIYNDDCNTVLLSEIFPKVRYDHYRRALCLLDPYGLQLKWEVIQHAGRGKAIDMFLNFPVMDMNRNVLWRDFETVTEQQKERLNFFWGDTSWKDVVYGSQGDLFGKKWKDADANEKIAEAFRTRLKDVAGYACVPKPLPMRNSIGATVYYLFFAAQKEVAEHIVTDIFNVYRRRGSE